MSRCWTCGSDYAGGTFVHFYTCPLCSSETELKSIRERLESSGATSIQSAMESALGEVNERLSEIASIIEWGFEEVHWRLDVMSGILRSIDETLKSPSATQANEWRRFGEELRSRGVLDECEKFYLKSLETSPLDYRTYIGLGKAYLQMNNIDKARSYWERSLPHAPKHEGIDYKSYSYRLMGRSYFCEGNVQQASALLKRAIELSPEYYLGHYDYAQYCALLGDKENCLISLYYATVNEPFIPLELIRREGNLMSLKAVEDFLRILEYCLEKQENMAKEANNRANQRWRHPKTASDYCSWRQGRDVSADLRQFESELDKAADTWDRSEDAIEESIQRSAEKQSLPAETIKERWPYVHLIWLHSVMADDCFERGAKTLEEQVKVWAQKANEAKEAIEKIRPRTKRSLTDRIASLPGVKFFHEAGWTDYFSNKLSAIDSARLELTAVEKQADNAEREFYSNGYLVVLETEAVNIYESICADIMRMTAV